MLTTEGAIRLLDDTAANYATYIPTIDAIRANLSNLQADQIVGIGTDNVMGWTTSDLQEAIAYQQLLQGLTSSTGLSAAGVLTGGTMVGGLASNSNGFWQRGTAVFTGFYRELVGISALITQYSGSINIPSFLAANNIQVNADFAALYSYCYNSQLDPSTVFAPSGINLGTFTITAANTGTITPGAFPTTNGYTSPTPSTDSFGNKLYVGGTPMAQGFAPCHTIRAHVTTAISGTCAVTVTANNQTGASHTWSCTLDNATAGTLVTLTPATGGDKCNSAATAISVSGTATSGGFRVETVALR